MKKETKEVVTIVVGMSIVSCIVLFCLFALWSTTNPKFQKRDKLTTAGIVNCDTDGVVCK